MSDNKASANKDQVLKYLNETIKQVENDELEYILVLKSSDNIVHPLTCFLKRSTQKIMASVMGYLDLMKNDLIEFLNKD